MNLLSRGIRCELDLMQAPLEERIELLARAMLMLDQILHRRLKQSPIHQISSRDDCGADHRPLHVGIGRDLFGPVTGLKQHSISQEKISMNVGLIS
jgi:hypothetical protein